MTTDTPKPKRKRPTSATAMSLKSLAKLGYVSQVVEQTIRGSGITFKRDLFGVIDIVAIEAGLMMPGGTRPTLGIQACVGGDHAKRRAKALAEPRLRYWLEAGHGFEIWSWRKGGPSGKRKTWTLRRERIWLSDLPASPAPAAAHAEETA